MADVKTGNGGLDAEEEDRSKEFLGAANEAYAALRADSKASAEFEEEASVWEKIGIADATESGGGSPD